MEEEIIIRNLEKKDYKEVFDLERQVHLLHYNNRPDLFNDVKDLFPISYYESLIDDENNISIGIENNNKIVAIILSEIKETIDIPIIRKRKYCYIHDIVVDENNRRKGYEKLLFNELRKRINELNINDIELNVWPFNKGAIAFYESLGMTVKNIKYELNNNINMNSEKIEIITTQNIK